MADQHGVAGRRELRALGVSAAAERWRVASGEWDRPAPDVVRVVATPPTPSQALMIALIQAGPSAVVSHQSAAWLWDLLAAPDRHTLTVPRQVRVRAGPGIVHRLSAPAVPVHWRGFPCTNPLRTLVDLAGVVAAPVLDEALDRAVATRLVTVAAVRAEMGRLSQKGRKGTGAMARALRRRGLVEGPHPSVLEAVLHRVLRAVGIEPVRVEVKAGPDGRYRIDVEVITDLLVEVDGHAFHSTPEQKAYDERRRNAIRLTGSILLVYTWRDLLLDQRRVVSEILAARARLQAGGRLGTR